LKEVGEYFGLDYSRVSEILTEERKAKRKTPFPLAKWNNGDVGMLELTLFYCFYCSFIENRDGLN
jgi:hypothetical protein